MLCITLLALNLNQSQCQLLNLNLTLIKIQEFVQKEKKIDAKKIEEEFGVKKRI